MTIGARATGVRWRRRCSQCSARCRGGCLARPIRRAGRGLQSRDLHAGQRPAGGGGRRTTARRWSPTWSGTRSAPPTSRPGKSGIAHFLEHLMFKGTKTRAPGEFSRDRRAQRRQRQRLHLRRLHRLLPDVAQRPAGAGDALEADRMANLELTDAQVDARDAGRAGGAAPAGRQRSRRRAGGAGRRGAVPQPSLPAPVIGWEDEVRALTTAGRARRSTGSGTAQQRGPGRRRRRHRRGSPDAGRGELRPISKSPTPAHRLAEPAQRAARRVVLRDDRVRQPACSGRTWRRATGPAPPSTPMRCRCWPN